MTKEKKTILRTVRLEPGVDKELQRIAEKENRTISNAIYNLLKLGIAEYITEITPDYYSSEEYLHDGQKSRLI